VLQCVAMCCVAVCCNVLCCSVLQCAAVRCSVLQCVAVCCCAGSVLQCVAVSWSVLQCVATGDGIRVQVLRYKWGGNALWQTQHGQAPRAPPCPRCNAPRCFEAQVAFLPLCVCSRVCSCVCEKGGPPLPPLQYAALLRDPGRSFVYLILFECLYSCVCAHVCVLMCMCSCVCACENGRLLVPAAMHASRAASKPRSLSPCAV